MRCVLALAGAALLLLCAAGARATEDAADRWAQRAFRICKERLAALPRRLDSHEWVCGQLQDVFEEHFAGQLLSAASELGVPVDAADAHTDVAELDAEGDEFIVKLVDRVLSEKKRHTDGELQNVFYEMWPALWARKLLTGDANYVKSERPPKRQSLRKARVVVASTFAAQVRDAAHDVFVEFYAPWCGHCQQLAPAWDRLAEAFNVAHKERVAAAKADGAAPPRRQIVVAKMDHTNNDLAPEDAERFAINGYPSLYYLRADDKENPIAYDGKRTLGALAAFVQEQKGGAEQFPLPDALAADIERERKSIEAEEEAQAAASAAAAAAADADAGVETVGEPQEPAPDAPGDDAPHDEL